MENEISLFISDPVAERLRKDLEEVFMTRKEMFIETVINDFNLGDASFYSFPYEDSLFSGEKVAYYLGVTLTHAAFAIELNTRGASLDRQRIQGENKKGVERLINLRLINKLWQESREFYNFLKERSKIYGNISQPESRLFWQGVSDAATVFMAKDKPMVEKTEGTALTSD